MGEIKKTAGSTKLSTAYQLPKAQVGALPTKQRHPPTEGGEKHLIDTVDSAHGDDSLSTAGKRLRQSDYDLPEMRVKKQKSVVPNHEQLAKEALLRIKSSERCSQVFEKARISDLPEIFIDSKEHGRRVANHGRDILNQCQSNRALIENGQEIEGPTSWGRVFVALPSSDKMIVLDDFAKVMKHQPSLSLLAGIVSIGDIAESSSYSQVGIYAAPARLELIFRFGLLGCIKSEAIADRMKSLIPAEKRQESYSFALQNAVEFNDLSMSHHCFANSARVISPDEDAYDYRGESPIEIAFQSGSEGLRGLMLKMVDKTRDLDELRSLFLDKERWGAPPAEILRLIS